MISELPWKLDKENPSRILDANNWPVAENYTFLHVDDFESICKIILDARRYRWLRWKYSLGNETYLAEEIISEQQIDKYIDNKIMEEN